MGTILVVHDELNSLELPVFKKDDRSKPELRYFPSFANRQIIAAHRSDKDRIVFFGLNNCCTQINAMSPALYLFFLILCGFNSYRHLASYSFWLHSDYFVENRTEIKARRGSYTPSVWNTKPDDAIRECHQLCKSVSRSLHG